LSFGAKPRDLQFSLNLRPMRYSDFRNARYPNEQLGIGKVFSLKEGLTFDVRADFFNLFNR
jgi:hypothetical protein